MLSRYYFSFITVVGNVLIDTAALYVGTLVLGLIFPSISPPLIVASLAFAAAAYTIPRGLNTDIKTEVIQAIVYVFGSCNNSNCSSLSLLMFKWAFAQNQKV